MSIPIHFLHVQSVFKTVPKAALVNPPFATYTAVLSGLYSMLGCSRICGIRTPLQDRQSSVLTITLHTLNKVLLHLAKCVQA